MQKKRYVCILTTVLIAFFTLPFQITADSETSISFELDENDVSLTDTMDVHVDNGDQHGTITITDDGEVVFENELDAIKIRSIDIVSTDDGQYGIITYRYDGSSNALYFDVLHFDGENTANIYTSDVYEHGSIDVQKDELILNYPEYESGDISTEPAEMVTQTFQIGGDEVIESKKDVESIDYPENENSVNSNEYNPPYAETNKVLTEEALKANVAPEIVKAIAYQETGWQQYWEDIPESVKACETDPEKGTIGYDGTQVKLGYDCIGIGIMQISNHMDMEEGKEKEEYIEKLKTDMRFNIQEGIRILKDKWDYHKNNLIPTVNDNDPMVVENWYFAILAYNGLLPRNNPLDNAYTAYQEEVFERMEDYSLLDINPFPTYKLNPYELDNGQMRFDNDNVSVEGPSNLSGQSLEKSDTARVKVNGLRVRETPGGTETNSFDKGTKVTVTGKYKGNDSRENQFVWMPVESADGVSGYVASSYLSPSDEYMDVHRLYGDTRYETSVSVANNGWHWRQPSDVIIGRGDLPIDALTGSVLAAHKDSPLLLTQTDKLTTSVEKELDRLGPENIYILGGDKTAISPEVEQELEKKYGKNHVQRIDGKDRYHTAVNVAGEIQDGKQVEEVFVTTGDEESSDPLAIAPYAGKENIPILLTGKTILNDRVSDYINQNNVQKVTIIGGKQAISAKVEKSLEDMLGAKNVERVKGDTRFSTSTEIVDKYYDTDKDFDRLFISQGLEIADALSVSPMAADLGAPIVLTQSDKMPAVLSTWIDNKVDTKPNIYFLGGDVAINENVKKQLIENIR